MAVTTTLIKLGSWSIARRGFLVLGQLLSRIVSLILSSLPPFRTLPHPPYAGHSSHHRAQVVMRHLSLPYSSALSLARSSRPLISPNTGFEYQLRIWDHCKYDVYAVDSTTSATGAILKEKPAYKAWKVERDNMMNKGEEAVNKARFSSMASMAAQFGRRRLGKEEEGENWKTDIGDGKGKSESWERVEKMEQEWTRRLIAGEGPAGADKVETAAPET